MEYPYYIVPDIETYRSLDPKSDEARELSRKIAANIGDYASLRLILGIDPPEFARFYPDMETSTPSTLDTIDSFLDKYDRPGNPSPENVPGLAPYDLESEVEAKSQPSKEDITEGRIAERKTYEAVNQEIDSLPSLIKNHRYAEAMALIERQNLNNPQKSIYFAHQMRFLKKLIAIDKIKKQTKG